MSASASARAPHARKGKARQHVSRQEGPGGTAGVVVPLELITDSPYEAVYTVPILVGSNQQNLSLQVDTGSSDLWIASKACSTSSCGQTGGHLYDPSSSTPSGKSFSITYAEGEVSGPIVWDSVTLGGYNVTEQALAAASTVNDEPLASDFSGILGLALPLDSIIAQEVPPERSNSPDGAAFASNLFSMTPTNTAPRAPFLSLALERPGSDAVPSVLGIGRHPDELVPDPGKIRYSGLVTESAGTLFWQASVQAITVYVSGQPRPVQLGPSVTGAMYPSAVLDSGTPVILTTPPIANGIYGALGISPSSDGQYYVPCTTPINMTITLDDRPEIPLHPLDLSFPPPSTSSTSMCIGMIQNAGSTGSSEAQIADMILGVPFLRNTYTVMAYEPPDDSGNFPANDSMAAANYLVRPRLGLLNLTNITAALQEFNTVRVQHEPLGQSSPGSGGSSPSSSSGKHLPVGVDVLFGLIAFFGLCFTLFTARWMYMRRKWRRSPQGLEDGDRKAGSYGMSDIPYTMARRTSDTEIYGDSEDTLHSLHYDDHRHPKDVASQYTDDTALTRVEDTPLSEFGFIQKKRDISPGRSTLDASWDPLMPNPSRSPSTSPHRAPSLVLARSDYSVASSHQRTPSGEPGVAVPLLAHTRQDSHLSRSEDVAEFGMGLGLRTEFEPDGQSLAGVGTAARGGRIDVHERQSSAGSVGSIISLQGARGSRARPRRTPSGPRRAERMSTGASNKSSSPVR